ncbi:hypothetical protein RFI_16539 [Reticulomyxa filosa]|uniref:Rab-GAP TBC domain-containing protein n=1 Tax=Reticulomyxa filosa TaxID=46433 RepID=X6N439_RETFI|nr:hypothetical protein RFI_16539 [Reticulomyxa filosa]|eukprot:ETO20678.1 hypothetical protein RFI_16539 [Reticulomyxa filosa]
MNFVAGTVVFAIGDELNAFAVFCQLMKLNESPLQNVKLLSPRKGGYTAKGTPLINPLSETTTMTTTMTSSSSPRIQVDRYDNRRKYTHSHCSGGRISKNGQDGYGLRYVFTKSLPGCVVALLQFENLLQKHIPRLYEHLCTHGITIQSFASEWFMTLFSYVLPLTVTFRVFDLFLVDGSSSNWLGHFISCKKLSLFVTYNVNCFLIHLCSFVFTDHLLMLEDDAILMYLKQFPDSGIFLNPNDDEDGDSFIQHAMSFKVTNSHLHLICTNLLAKTMAHNTNDNLLQQHAYKTYK